MLNSTQLQKFINKYLVLMFVCLMLVSSVVRAGNGESEGDEKSGSRRSYYQLVAMAASWRENSLLLRSDGAEFKINTLNSAARLGLVQYFSGARYFLRYGVIVGQSANDSAISTFAYFQRSTLLAGIDLALGKTLFSWSGSELSLALGGFYRTIKHTMPSDDYQMKTASRFVPNFSLEFLLRLSNSFYWRQSVGTQGAANDTFWSAGFGYDI